jgi:tRNA pseudouridine55 synthase
MDGVLLADKPAGVSSHDVVLTVRRALGGHRRTGHAGTLDPFATGLLLVLIGRATRIQRFLLTLPKTYTVVCRLGALSSTGDPEGEIVETGRMPAAGVELPTGQIEQRPPAFSAVHSGGERAYRRARRGETFELAPRTVTVYRFVELWREGDRAAFEIECSSGTYVRSLIADLGDAYCEQLRRTAIRPFDVGDAVEVGRSGLEGGGGLERSTLERGGPPGPIIDLGRALAFLPTVGVAGEWARRASHGVAVPAPEGTPTTAGAVVLADADGPVAVAEARAGERGVVLKPVVGLRG